MDPLLKFEDRLIEGELVERPNRFVLMVRFETTPKRVFLADPGALENVIEPGRPVLCSPADGPDRKTDYDAIAVEMDGIYVSVRAAFANLLFEAAIEQNRLSAFEGYHIRTREPALPDHGRTDFRLEDPDRQTAFVEVKSCTHIENGIAKFPDRQTERGRRHLRSLASIIDKGDQAYVVFVIQRPDAETFEPYRAVDPEFADLLERVSEAGVGLHAMVTAFEPPAYSLVESQIPIELDG